MPRAKKMPEGTPNTRQKKVGQQLYLPKDTQRYKARKLQIMIRQYERKINDEKQGFIDPRSYITLIDSFVEVVKEIGKQNDEKRMDNKISKRATEEVGDGNGTGLDTGISTENPFA